ncbi:serine/threonine protein kinase [bacterium]|nr:serine/threonine protein kinase [bacterium]
MESFEALGLVGGRYRLLRELGRGAFGAVYAAVSEGGEERVAVKVLTRFDEGALARFRREAEVLARVEPHPNVVRVLGAGEHRGLPYIVMELVLGGSLALALARGERPTFARAAELARGVALGLEHIHRSGVLHRGLALDTRRVTRLTTSGQLLGSPPALAPEQLEPGSPRIGPATDIYAACVLLFELLTGRPPFLARTLMETIDLVRGSRPPRPVEIDPSVPASLSGIVERGLARNPLDRPRTAGELADLLRDWSLEGRR